MNCSVILLYRTKKTDLIALPRLNMIFFYDVRLCITAQINNNNRTDDINN